MDCLALNRAASLSPATRCLLTAVVATGLAALGGCGKESPGALAGLDQACDASIGCADNLYCYRGICRQLCNVPGECPRGLGCRDGVCQRCVEAVDCAGLYGCDDGLCLEACGGDGDCKPSGHCDGSGDCVTDHGIGGACDRIAQCATGGCVTGVCCAETCSAACQACAAQYTGAPDGQCAPVLVGLDPRNDCSGALACDGGGQCFDGQLGDACSEGFECALGHCATGVCCDQACTGLNEGCNALGVCIHEGCGNGHLESGEQCDDGPANSDTRPDACRMDCTDPRCQDSVTDSGEGCDDGNDLNGDGCSASCQAEFGWACTGSPSQCACAEGFQDNDRNGTCSPTCRTSIELGFLSCNDFTGCDDSQGTARCQCAVYVNGAWTGTQTGASWDTPYASLQAGIDQAAALWTSGDYCRVWVAEGVYYARTDSASDTFALGEHVAIMGGFVGDELGLAERDPELHPTVLDGAREDDANSRVYHVVTGASHAALDGLVIRHGRADGTSPGSNFGGGLYNDGASLLVISNVVFYTNHAAGGGAMYSTRSVVQIDTCSFIDNTASSNAGGIVGSESEVNIYNSVFWGNSAGVASGAIHQYGSIISIHGSTFINNTATLAAGAIQTYDVTSVVIRNSVFTDNSCITDNLVFGGGAIMFNLTDTISVDRSFFMGNQGFRGGAIFIRNSRPSLTNLVFFRNTAMLGAAVHDNEGWGTTIQGCTFSGNESISGTALFEHNTPTATVIINSILADGSSYSVDTVNSGTVSVGNSIIVGGINTCRGCIGIGSIFDSGPGFSPLPVSASGTWSEIQSNSGSLSLHVTGSNWPAHSLRGALVQIDVATDRYFPILDNESSYILIGGLLADSLLEGSSFQLFDLRLGAASPAIDAGSDLDSSQYDILGQERICSNIQAGCPDLGAFEFHP